MNKQEFMKTLEKELSKYSVSDIEDILHEYEEHFSFKLLDGYTEKEVSIGLGDPVLIANQYKEDTISQPKSGFFPTILGLYGADLVVFMFFILLLGWVIGLFASSVVSFAIGISFVVNISPMGLIPPTPYWCGAVLGVSMLSFGLFLLVASFYNYKYFLQLLKSYGRFHKNTINKAKNRPLLPSVASYPMMNKKQTRFLRSIALFSVTSFGISTVLGYIVCAMTAQSFEWWHVFGWFM